MNLRRVRALIKKECFQIVRDPSSILISVVLPLILLFIYGFGISLDAEHLKIGVVTEDTAPDASSFIQSITDSRFFSAKVTRNRQEMEEALTLGEIKGFVVIPSYFSKFRLTSQAPIQVIADGSEPNTANFLQNYVQGAWSNWQDIQAVSTAAAMPSRVKLQPRFWYNEQLESRNFLIPGSIAIIMALIGTLLTALVVAREWERGTMEALMATPVTIQEIVISKLVPYFFLGIGSMTFCVGVAYFLYQVPLRGTFLVLTLISSIFLIASLAIGLLVSTLAKNQFVAAQASMTVAFLPAFMLSGFVFEISSMPLPIQIISRIIPASYYVSSLQTVFLVGNVWALFIPNMLAMSLFALVIFSIIKAKMVKRLD